MASALNNFRQPSNPCLCVVKDQFVFVVNSQSQFVDMLDTSLTSHTCVHKPTLPWKGDFLRVGVLNDCIYALCYHYNSPVNTIAVFSLNTQKWQRLKSMPNKRDKFGVGVLNNLIYSVNNFYILIMPSILCFYLINFCR